MASLMHIFYGLLLLMSFIAYKQRNCWSFVWQVNGWRGVIQQPFLWILLICYVDPKSLMSSIHRFGKYFQFPLAIILFDRTMFYVDDPVTLEGILTAPECINKTFLQNGFFANKGLLHAKDEQWKIRRKQLNPAFSHNTLINFLGDFNRVANELSDKMKLDLRGENRTSFQQLEDLVSRAVLEVSCLTIMGVSTHFTQNDDQGIAAAYRYLMELTALRILKPWYQIDSVFRVMDKKNFEISQRAKHLVEEFVANIVQQKQLERQKKQYDHAQGVDGVSAAKDAPNDHADKRDGNIAEKRIFIDQLFHLAQQDKLTFENVMEESQSMMVVSFETVSTCIMNVLLCLALNRECQEKLRQEIKRILSKKLDPLLKNAEKDTGPDAEADNYDNVTVTMAHLQCMPYLDMILNESLRLLTTVPMNMRRVSTDFPLKILQRQNKSRPPQNGDNYLKSSEYSSRCKSVIVPKGTMIAVDTFNMQRNVDLWGPNALKFYPEHFAKESEPVAVDENTNRRHSYAFVPFSKGVRTCIGHRYSIYLSKILLIKLIESFDFTTNIQFNDLEYYEGISLKYRNSKDIFFDIHQVSAGEI